MAEHREWRIYDECGHDHREGESDTRDVRDVGICCEDGYLYSLCEKCHTFDGECCEHSPEEQAWPCDAAKALERVEALEGALRDLVERILLVANSQEYKAVWTLAMIHDQAYAGPTFEAELKAAVRALAGEGDDRGRYPVGQQKHQSWWRKLELLRRQALEKGLRRALAEKGGKIKAEPHSPSCDYCGAPAGKHAPSCGFHPKHRRGR